MDKRNSWRYGLSLLMALVVLLCLGTAGLAEGSESLPAPNASITSTVTRGDFVCVTINEAVEGALGYHMYLLDPDSGEPMYYYSRVYGTERPLRIGTGGLEAGAYTAEIYAFDSEGVPGETLRLGFTIAEPASPSGIVFKLGRDSAREIDAIVYSVYAPGAERIQLWSNDLFDEFGSDGAQGGWYPKHAGEYELYALAFYPDGSIEESERIPVTVTPVDHVGACEVNAPAIVTKGQPFTVTYTAAENAAELGEVIYGVYVNNEWEGDYFWNNEHTGVSAFTISTDELEAGRYYNASFYAYVDDCRSFEYAIFFFVDSGETDNRVHLTIDGGTDDVYRDNADGVDVHLDAPGMTAARLVAGDWQDDWYNWENWADCCEDGFVDYHFGMWGNETRAICAEVTFDQNIDFEDENWIENVTWVRSNIVTVHMTLGEILDTPEFTLSANTVERGGVLTANIIRVDDRAEDVWIDVYRASDNRHMGYFNVSDDSCAINTSAMQPNMRYRAELCVNAYGMQMNCQQVWFAVTAPPTDEPFFSADHTEITTMEWVSISGYVPGATALELQDMSGEYGLWTDLDGFSENYIYGTSGVKEYRLNVCYGDPDNEDDWQLLDTVLYINVSAENGHLDKAVIRMPGQVEAGEDFDVRFYSVDNATTYALWVVDEYTDERVYDDWIVAEPVEFYDWHCPASWVCEPGHSYRFIVFAHGEDYDQSQAEMEFVVVSGRDEDLALTIDGSTDDRDLPVNKPFVVRVEAPEDATGIRIYKDGERYEFGGNSCEWETTVDRDRPYAFTARYTTDGYAPWTDWNDLEWSDFAPTVRITGTFTKELEMPEWSAPESVKRGQDLEVTLVDPHPIDDGRHYSAWIDQWTGLGYEDTGVYADFDGDTVRLNTLNLAPGRYRLYVGNDGEGYLGCAKPGDVYVIEGDDGDLTFEIYANDVLRTAEDFNWVAYAPGAERIRLYVDGEENGEWEGNYVSDYWGTGDSGTYEFWVVAEYPDGDTQRSSSRAVRFEAEYGFLADPVIEMATEYDPGEDVTVTIHPVENAEWYNLMIWDDAGEWMDGADLSVDGGTWVFGGSLFEAGREYVFQVDTMAFGYEIRRTYVAFGIRGETDSSISLTINGSDEDQSFKVGEEFDVRVEAPNATLYRFFFAPTDWCDVWPNENGVGEDRYSRGSVESMRFYARYTTQEIDDDTDLNALEWSGKSNVVNVAFTADGYLSAPVFTSPTEVQRGHLVEIELQNRENMEGIFYSVHLDYWNPEENAWNWLDGSHMGLDSGDTLYYPTGNLEQGHYRLWMDNEAFGYAGAGTWHDLYVTDSDRDVTLAIAPTALVASQPATISAYAPGATRIQLYLDEEEWDWWDGESISDSRSWDGGVYKIYAKATYPNGTTKRSRTITLNVTSLGKLDAPQLIGPAYICEGQDYTFSFTGVDKADSYWFWMDQIEFHPGMLEVDPQPETEYTIPANMLEANRDYTIRLNANAWNWDGNGTWLNFKVLPESSLDEVGFLTVNGSAEPQDILVFEDYDVHVDLPENVSALCLYKSDDGAQHHREIHDTAYDEVWNNGSIGTVSMFAVFTTDPIDWETFDGDWNNVRWTGVTNVVTMHMIANGQYPSPNVTLLTDTVRRGGFVQVRVNDVTGDPGEYYHAWADGWNDETQEYEWQGDWRWDEIDTISISTANLKPGTYKLWFGHWASGIEESHTRKALLLTVEEPESDFVFDISPREIMCELDFSISIYAPGAEKIDLYQDQWLRDTWDSETVDAMRGNGTIGNYTYYAVAHYPDGTMRRSDSIVQTVTAEDRLAAPQIHLSKSTYKVGEDVVYTVDSVENAGWMASWVNNLTDNTDLIERQDISSDTEYRISADSFEAGKVYAVYVDVGGAKRWDGNGSAVVFSVTDGQQNGPTLTVNGSNANQSIPGMTNFNVRLEAENATAFRFFDGHNWNDRLADENGVWEGEWSHASDQVLGLFGVYTTDPIDEYTDWDSLNWSEVGNVITVTFTRDGVMPMPQFDAPDQVVRGSFLKIDPIDPSVESFNADAALYIWEESTGAYRWMTGDGLNENGSIYLDTHELEAGEYWLDVTTYGAGLRSSTAHGRVTVVEPDADEVVVSLRPEQVMTQQGCTVTAYAPGATKINLYIGMEHWGEYDGDNVCWDVWKDDAGRYEVDAIATYPDGTTRQSATQWLTITSQGRLAEPVLHVPGSIFAYEALRFSVDGVENAEHYHAWAEQVDGDRIFDEGVGPWNDLWIDAECFEAGRLYRVGVTVIGSDWDSNWSCRDFRVVDRGAATVLNLPEATREIEEEAFCGIPVEIVKLPDCAASIGRRAFANCGNLSFVYIPDNVRFIDSTAFENSPYVVIVCNDSSYAAGWADANGFAHRAD